MEKLPTSSILEFNPGTLQNVRKLYNFNDTKRLEEAIDILQEWVRKQPHFTVTEFDRDFLERIIISNKGLLERCKSRLDKMCTLRTLMPEYFKPINIAKELCNLDCIQDAILPKMTHDNCRIHLVKNSGKQFSSQIFFDFYRKIIMYWQYALRYDYYAGLICVYDLTEANIMELVTNMSVNYLRQFTTIIMQGFGARIKGIYMISDSKFISTLVDLIKPFLNKKVSDRIQVLNNVEMLKEKFPVDMLPRDYGGNEKSLTELTQDWLEELSRDDFVEYLKKMSEMKTDESKRQEGKFNEEYLGMAGTFRNLTVD